MAELFGRTHGCAHGRGGSMHLLDVSRGYYGGWGIVGGQLPIATGMALSLVRAAPSRRVVCELGDGAANMGAFHESLNLAAVWDLPVVFLVINNLYGMGTAVDRASAEPDLFKRAAAYRMEGERVDGDDSRGGRGGDRPAARRGRARSAARPCSRPSPIASAATRSPTPGSPTGPATRSTSTATTTRWSAPASCSKRAASRPTASTRSSTRSKTRSSASVAFAEADAPPPVDRLATGMYTRGSDEQFERMRPGSPVRRGRARLRRRAGE